MMNETVLFCLARGHPPNESKLIPKKSTFHLLPFLMTLTTIPRKPWTFIIQFLLPFVFLFCLSPNRSGQRYFHHSWKQFIKKWKKIKQWRLSSLSCLETFSSASAGTVWEDDSKTQTKGPVALFQQETTGAFWGHKAGTRGRGGWSSPSWRGTLTPAAHSQSFASSKPRGLCESLGS